MIYQESCHLRSCDRGPSDFSTSCMTSPTTSGLAMTEAQMQGQAAEEMAIHRESSNPHRHAKIHTSCRKRPRWHRCYGSAAGSRDMPQNQIKAAGTGFFKSLCTAAPLLYEAMLQP